MKLAFCLYKYFPFGGLQRDFLRIAQTCQQRGHEIHVYTFSWQGDIPDSFHIHLVPSTAKTNHQRYQQFTHYLQRSLIEKPVDKVIGFNKMPGLDIYYAADPCFVEKANNSRGWWYQLTPRYRHFAAYEEAVFSNNTEILMISDTQKPLFIQHYQTSEERFHLLPPGISKDRMAPDNYAEIRQVFRQEFNVKDNELLILMIGSGFKVKGLDRALLAAQSLPDNIKEKTQFIVIGQDNPKPFLRIIKRLGLRNNVTILNGRDDIPRFLLGADLLIHPAYSENTGTVLLEAIVAGLPVLATDICGYAHYIEQAGAGQTIESPFNQTNLNKKLLAMLTSDKRNNWKKNGLRFAENADIYSLPERAADLIATL